MQREEGAVFASKLPGAFGAHEQVRSPFKCAQQRLLAPPAFYVGMMAANEDVGHDLAAK